jgi:hypothetical protein
VSAPEAHAPVPLLQRVFLASFSLFYGYVLQALPVMQFKDRANYLNYAENSSEILTRYVEDGLIALLANEPVWLVVNSFLALFLDPESVIRAIVFISASLFAYVFTRADPRNSLWLMLFLLMPQMLKNFITHLRQGLGLAIFFAGYFASRRALGWLLMAAAPLIHASFFFVVAFVMLPAILRNMRLAVDVRLLTMGGFSLFISLSIGFIAALVGARQISSYEFAMTDVSGLGFLFWLAVAGLFVLQGKIHLERHQAAAGVLLLYLLSYFLVEVTARIFESGMPLVLLAALAMTSWRRWAFVSLFVVYSVILWMMRLASATPF